MRAGICNAGEHAISRRRLLGGLLAGSAASALATSWLPTAWANELKAKRKKLLIVNHGGGLSQLESWDPKPGTDTGGPCQAIATSVPGMYVSEWLPHTARQMHRLFVVRSLSTGENNHGPAHYLMFSGRREGAALVYPHLACVANRFLTPATHPVPGLVAINGPVSPAFLGPQFGAVNADASKPPAHLDLRAPFSADMERRRQEIRRRMNQQFSRRRGSSETTAYAQSFEQAQQLMANKKLFDTHAVDPREIDRYGGHEFGRQCLLARSLLEADVTCVSVSHNGYDTHAENFNVHIDLLEQFDRPFACLIQDLAERGMLEHTLVIAMGEFGRTPHINHRFGRDHWSATWSAAFAGVGFPAGAVYGQTNDNGTEVKEGKVEAAPLFHTFCKALSIDASQNWIVDGQEVPIGDPAAKAVDAMLA